MKMHPKTLLPPVFLALSWSVLTVSASLGQSVPEKDTQAADANPPPYKVGVLYDTDPASTAGWKSAAQASQGGLELTEIAYANATHEAVSALDCLVLPDSPNVPATLQPVLEKFAEGGGDLILAGGRAFSQLPAGQKPFTDLVFDPQPRFQFQGEYSVQPWSEANVKLPSGSLSANKTTLSGCSALGFSFLKKSRFFPLLEVVDSKGRRKAWAVSLLQHTSGEFKDGNWLLAGVEQPAFYQSPALLDWMLKTVRSYTPPAAKVAATAPPVTPPTGRLTINKSGQFVKPDGSPFFVIGANYCGLFDAKFEEFFSKGSFSADDLDAEFAKFRKIGINALRSFSFGRMGTLKAPGDRIKVIRDCARHHGIYIMPEIGLKALLAGPLDITDNAKHAGAVARAYRGEPMVLGYDLANEPYITEVGSMTFHGQPSPIVQAQPYETMADLLAAPYDKNWVDRQMKNTDGWLNLPKSIPNDTKRELLAATGIWLAYMRENGNAGNESTFPGLNDRIDIANSGKYEAFFTALNATFGQWIDEVSQAIRAEDPEALITVGYNRGYVALPVNDKLDFISNHIYQKPFSFKDTEISLTTFDRLHKMHPDKPITLGEFGLSNGLQLNGSTADYQTQALWEILHYIYPLAHGFSGSMKWMDNDWTTPYIARYAKWWTDPKTLAYEEQFGFFFFDGTPGGSAKPVAWCVQFFADYLQSNPPPGKLTLFESKNQVRTGFEYRAETAWIYGGETLANRSIRSKNTETKVLMARWDTQTITLMSTVDLEIEIDPAAMVNPPAPDSSLAENWQKIRLGEGKPLTITR
jgi:hypothetical protein